MTEVTVRNDEASSAYVAEVDGEQAGFAAYQMRAGASILSHTEVEGPFEGRGVGSALARFALDDIRARGLKAVPRCSFMHGWIERHPDYADLVVD